MSWWERARWLWRTRNCTHQGELRAITGEERQMYGFAFRCRECGKVLKNRPRGETGSDW